MLRSLVYNSGKRLTADTTEIQYFPNNLYKNSDLELLYDIEGDSTRWSNSDLLTSDITLLKDTSYKAKSDFKKFDIEVDFAVKDMNGEFMYDGWYTFLSIVIEPVNTYPPIPPLGTIADNGGDIQYYSTHGWISLVKIESTIPIYQSVWTTFSDEVGVTFDFFVSNKIKALYKTLLDNKLHKEWFNKLNILSPKLRTIEGAIEAGRFDLAQQILNSVDTSLLFMLI